MCGGIAFKLSKIPREDLVKVYGDKKAALLARKGEAESRFWDERPVLPVKEGNNLALYDWGNRDKNIDLPRTGWAKIESLETGKWDHLNPERVTIPADKGCEKGIWFDTSPGIEGIKIKRGAEARVYMVTRPSSADYRKKTGHDREPVLLDKKLNLKNKKNG